jgi:cbb3-type cytochrome oxidase maturation protein
MIVILLLIPLSLLMAGGFLWAFVWAVRSGQYDDTCTPSMRILADDGTLGKPGNTLEKPNHGKADED